MSINAISSAMSASVYLQNANKLSDELTQKLLDLGINPDGINSVSEANAAISKAEEEKSSQEDTENQEDTSNSEDSSAIMERAKKLAEKVGVKVSDDDTVDDILDDIQDVVDKMLSYAINKNDRNLYEKYQSYQSDLKDIEADQNGGGFSNSFVFNFLDMVAEQNKYALNLNKKEE